jgi:feruloyl esterase
MVLRPTIDFVRRSWGWYWVTLTIFSALFLLGLRQAQGTELPCDDSIKSKFSLDSNVSVSLVKMFAKGADLNLDGNPTKRLAARDLCLVKLLVGPGNPGAAGSPSTSPGIGIEVWLPKPWNQRVHVLGGGGWGASPDVRATDKIGSNASINQAYAIAGAEGSVSAITDGGHSALVHSGAFAMLPDGKINQTLWKDFAQRAIHETAVAAKALASIYYGEAARYSYFDGCSTGGRQGHMEAQTYPDDFDGILAGDPAINWTSFIPAELYPQIVMQRDLAGGLLSEQQLNLVSSSAISACDADLNGDHAGYVSDPSACHYNPEHDNSVLCESAGGNNKSAGCVDRRQAHAINKMWFGPTADGSVPNPDASNGYADDLTRGHLWFGLTRGTQLFSITSFPSPGLAGSSNGIPRPFSIATDVVALILGKPALATPEFHNETGNGADQWKSLSYGELKTIEQRGAMLQASFSNINTDKPDLTAFRNRKAKMLLYHGMADQVIPIQGTTHYYFKVAAKMGGIEELQRFYRYYQIPGMGHCGAVGSVDGIRGVSPPAKPPLPAPGQLFSALTDWVETGKAPEDLVVKNADATISRPLCAYPARLHYRGGEKGLATSYSCER